MGKINRIDLSVGICGFILSVLYYSVFIPFGIEDVMSSSWLAHPLFSKADFVPKIWSGLLMVSSLVVLIEGSFKRTNPKNAENGEDAGGNSKIVAVSIFFLLIIMIGYIVMLVTLGFCISTIISLSLSMWLFGYRKIVTILLSGITVTTVMYLVFTKLLYVRFPGAFF